MNILKHIEKKVKKLEKLWLKYRKCNLNTNGEMLK